MIKIEDYRKEKNLTDSDFGWLWLDMFQFLNANKKNKIRAVVGKGEELFNLAKYEKEMIEICGENNYIKMTNALDRMTLEVLFQDIVKSTDFISIDHEDYPSNLRDIECPPTVLYYKGDLSLLKTRCIAVVGTRLFSAYGYGVTEKFINTLANSKMTIVSGLNEGLDTITHKLTLEHGGKTIAVISGGINKIYPAMNTELCQRIAKEGLVISEWPPRTDSLRYMFPIRGRIITGISEAILITEAGLKSGIRYIVDYALDQNRTIYSVPGNITSYRSSLNNSLIKSCQSMSVTHPDEILEDMNIVYEPFKESEEPTLDEAKIYDAIEKEGEAHFEAILSATGMPQNKLMGLLTGLEIRGKIKKISGNKYIRLS